MTQIINLGLLPRFPVAFGLSWCRLRCQDSDTGWSCTGSTARDRSATGDGGQAAARNSGVAPFRPGPEKRRAKERRCPPFAEHRELFGSDSDPPLPPISAARSVCRQAGPTFSSSLSLLAPRPSLALSLAEARSLPRPLQALPGPGPVPVPPSPSPSPPPRPPQS